MLFLVEHYYDDYTNAVIGVADSIEAAKGLCSEDVLNTNPRDRKPIAEWRISGNGVWIADLDQYDNRYEIRSIQLNKWLDYEYAR